MMSATLLANGAKVYIIGPKQEDLDRICKVYNDECERTKKSGRMHGIEGDVRKKVSRPQRVHHRCQRELDTAHRRKLFDSQKRWGSERGL